MKHSQPAIGQHISLAFAGETSTFTHPGYKDVPVSWFLCEVAPAVQETAIRDIEEMEGHGGRRNESRCLEGRL
jgi:hypothetical protein